MTLTFSPSGRHQRLLERAVTVFNSLRLLAYLPTVAAIAASGDASQHSLLTWAVWTGANLSTALWLWDRDGRLGGVAGLSLANGAVCAGIWGLILGLRF